MRCDRQIRLRFSWVALLLALLLSTPARADRSSAIASLPLAISSQCGFLGDCAHTDAIGLHLGTTAAVRFTGSHPDPSDPTTIVLADGQRFPVGTHVWIRNDGLLVTQRLETVGQLDKDTTDRALFVQKLGHMLYRAAKKEGKPCAFKADILRGTDPGLAAQSALDDFGGAAALLGVEFARLILCGDDSVMSGAGFLPYLGKGLRRGALRYRGQVGDGEGVLEHAQPVKPAENALTEKARAHIFSGDVDTKQGKSQGWHYERSADPAKGTYVKEDTRSVPNQHGVYEANVVIEGILKKERSSFFPRDWTQEQVEKAILEAYENSKPAPLNPTVLRGTAAGGMVIEIRTKNGKIQTAYPIYKIY